MDRGNVENPNLKNVNFKIQVVSRIAVNQSKQLQDVIGTNGGIVSIAVSENVTTTIAQMSSGNYFFDLHVNNTPESRNNKSSSHLSVSIISKPIY